MIAEKTKDRFASIHIDAIGLIRLGRTNDERLECLDQMITSVERLGGNIMIPTFSYTYPKNEAFCVRGTPSDVGLVTEYLRKRHPHKRTIDPFFSYLVFGEHKSEYFEVRDYECFGNRSLIADLFLKNGYVCCIGNVFYNTPTEVHYIEKLLGVDYRFNKVFSGVIEDHDGKRYQQKTTFYCRKYVNEVLPDMTRLAADLKENHMFEYWRADNVDFEIQAVSFHRLFDFVKARIAQNPGYLCATPLEYAENLKKSIRNWRK